MSEKFIKSLDIKADEKPKRERSTGKPVKKKKASKKDWSIGNKIKWKKQRSLYKFKLFIPEVKTGFPRKYIKALHEKTKFKTINLLHNTKYIIK